MIIRGREYSDEDEYLDEVQEYRLERIRRGYLERWPDDNEEEERDE